MLLVIGRDIEKDAAAVKKDFVRHALSLDEIVATTKRLGGPRLHEGQNSTSAAITEWDEALAQAMHALIGFDAIATNAFTDDLVALASYEAVRSIQKTGGPTKTAPEPPPAPAVTPATAA